MDFTAFASLAKLGFSPEVIVDGGANRGEWSHAMRGLFPSARIVCVEGNPECFPYLSGFDLIPALIGERDGEVEFHQSADSVCSTGNSILRERTGFFAGQSSVVTTLPMRRLDGALLERGIQKVDLLKLDLQGYELNALKGCRHYLSKTEFVLFEGSLVEYNRGQPLYADIHAFLAEHGFVLYDVLEFHRVAGVPFQMDFLYVREGSSFRPFFAGESNNVRIGASGISRWLLGSPLERDSVVKEIAQRKALSEFSVIDVGGAFHRGAESSVIDAVIDIDTTSGSDEKLRYFQFDINRSDAWDAILEYVAQNGKFDYSICSHALESVRDPLFVCEMLARISKEGFLAVTSKFRELSRSELGQNCYRGSIHHRWLFTIKGGKLLALPKLNVIDFLPSLDAVADMDESKSEIRLWWYNSIPLAVVSGDCSPSSAQSVIDTYAHLLNDDVR